MNALALPPKATTRAHSTLYGSQEQPGPGGPEREQQELSLWLSRLEGGIAQGQREERVGYLTASSKGQKEKPLYLKMNFTERHISLHLFLAHGVLNRHSHFISKMSLLKYIFHFSIFIREKESTRC